MLSFELSAIDLILAIAVIILSILYINSSAKYPTKEKLSVEERTPTRKLATIDTSLKNEEKNLLSTQPQTDSLKCPYRFGYLKKLDKAAPIPDECLGCPRIVECFGSN